MAASTSCQDENEGGEEPSYEGILSRQDGWLRGDLHMHTTYSDGWDDLATVKAIAGYLETEEFILFHPEFQGNGLDFIAITDHNDIRAFSDPDWFSERLILIRGEEYSTRGHANCFGIQDVVLPDPDGDGITLADVQLAVDDTHAQGGAFSMNHPTLPNHIFGWDIRNHDSVEIWNIGWAFGSQATKPEDLEEWETRNGPASPMFHRAIQNQGQGASMQALKLVEAQLSRGVHVAVVGGSDRHTLVPVGFPTTYVRAETTDEAGVVQGILDRHTFVTRTSASAQIELTIAVGDEEENIIFWEMGDAVPIPAAGTTVAVTVRIGRSPKGLLRLVYGEHVPTDEGLQTAPLGTYVLEEEITGNDYETTTMLSVMPGNWIYPMVYEPLLIDGLTPEQEELVRTVAVEAAATNADEFVGMAQLFMELGDYDILLEPELCDPATWQPDRLQCMTADQKQMATFYVPEMLDRAMNAITEDDLVTDWCMGAVGSAVMFVEEGA